MKSPLANGHEWSILESVESTQNPAADSVRANDGIGIVLAHDQLSGRGRFGRVWVSKRGDSLTFSLLFREYADHPMPYLVGMSVAVAAAGVLHCQLRWPNDLVEGGKKLGGILTEMILDGNGRRVPVVGVGINLNQVSFPDEIAEIATSAHLVHGGTYDALTVAKKIVDRLATLPEPSDWSALAPIWGLFDATPGKRFRLTTGEEAIAVGIGSEGQLMCAVDGETQSVLAAEALFGPAARATRP